MMTRGKLSRYFFVSILLGATLLFFFMVRTFLVPVLLATVFCTLFYPLFQRLTRLFRGRRSLAAIACCLLLLLGLVLPIYAVADMVVREAIDFYDTAEKQVRVAIEQGDAGPLGRLKRLPFIAELRLDQFDWRAALQNVGTSAGTFIAGLVRDTSAQTIQVLVVLFITLFTMFYFFRDGEDLWRRLKYLVPMEEQYEDAIAQRFAAVSRATIKGTLLIAILQGTLAGLVLWICGVGSPILWGVVATLFSIIPLVGAWLVLYPAAAIQLVTGHIWEGVVILVVTMVVIVNVDNLLRPRLVGQEAGLHDLMVFFSTLGGIGMFGAVGFIVGPVIAALFLAVLDIYSTKFKMELDDLGPPLNEAPGDPLGLEPATVPKVVAGAPVVDRADQATAAPARPAASPDR